MFPLVHNVTIHCLELGRTHCAVLAMPKVRAGAAVVCHQQLTSNTMNLWHCGNLGQIYVSSMVLFYNIYLHLTINPFLMCYSLNMRLLREHGVIKFSL